MLSIKRFRKVDIVVKKNRLLDMMPEDTSQRHSERKHHLKEKQKEFPTKYEGDIKRFIAYCSTTKQAETLETMLDYLYISLVSEKIKKTTWERRLIAIKKHFSMRHNVDFRREIEVANELSLMRKIYKEEQYAEQIQIQGKSAVNKSELLKKIHQLPTRAKAICLVNLITANRPNEMVRLKIRDFDLDERSLKVYMKKQRMWHHKRLTAEVTKAVTAYINEYNLKSDDYFVGRVYKNGVFESKLISETAYWNSLKKWIDLTAYNLRKTQVVAMHEAGADLSTIAKQTGHRSLLTLSKHYLAVSNTTVDKYL